MNGPRMLTSALVWCLIMVVIILVVARMAHCAELPNAPSVALRRPVETYPPDEAMIVHNGPPNRAMASHPPRIVDWSFVLGHAIYGASNAFDNWETQRYLGTCAWEGNPDLGRNPTARAQAIHGAVEFGAVVGGDLLLKWIGGRQGIPRWMNMLGGNGAAMYGAVRHTRAGMEWVRLCR